MSWRLSLLLLVACLSLLAGSQAVDGVACLSLLAGSQAVDGEVCSSKTCFRIGDRIPWAQVLDGFENEMPASSPGVTNYDFVVDCQSIQELLTNKLWEIKVADWTTTLPMLRDGYTGALTVVTGLYNKGKTWFLSRLGDITLPQGFTVNTQGVSIKAPQVLSNHHNQMVLVDSEGRHAPVTILGGARTDKIASESVSFSVLNDLADYHIVVVGDLTFPEQVLIDAVVNSRADKAVKEIIVVHNWRTQHCDTVRELFERYIKPSYVDGMVDYINDDDDDNNNGAQRPFVYSTASPIKDLPEQSVTILHAFLVNDETPNDRAWNDAVFRHIRNVLKFKISRTQAVERKFPLLQVSESLNKHLPVYLDCVCESPLRLCINYTTHTISLALDESCSSCERIRDFPLPEVYPTPANQHLIVPPSTRSKLDDGSFVMEIEVPGMPANGELTSVVEYDDQNESMTLKFSAARGAELVNVQLSAGRIIVTGVKPPSRLVTNAVGRAYGNWRAIAMRPTGFLQYPEAKMWLCNGVAVLYIPSSKPKPPVTQQLACGEPVNAN
jgi:hypothetical protein